MFAGIVVYCKKDIPKASAECLESFIEICAELNATYSDLDVVQVNGCRFVYCCVSDLARHERSD
jgi:hypothetical protein